MNMQDVRVLEDLAELLGYVPEGPTARRSLTDAERVLAIKLCAAQERLEKLEAWGRRHNERMDILFPPYGGEA